MGLSDYLNITGLNRFERKEKEEGNRGKGNAMKNVLMILVLLIAAGLVLWKFEPESCPVDVRGSRKP